MCQHIHRDNAIANNRANDHTPNKLVGIKHITLTMTINASVMATPDTPATKQNAGK